MLPIFERILLYFEVSNVISARPTDWNNMEMNMSVCHGRILLTGENLITGRYTVLSATLSTINPSWAGQWSNKSVRSERSGE